MTKMLSAKVVENAKPAKARREIPDGGNGLYLIVQPSGIKSWALRYRHRSQPRKLTLGKFPMLDLAAAREAARNAKEKIDLGRDPGAEKIAARDGGEAERDLYPAAAARFILRYAKPKNRSWTDTARRLGLRQDPNEADKLETIPGSIADKWKALQAGQITKRDILDLLDEVADKAGGLAANRTLAAMRRFFGWLVERDVIAASPCAGVKPPAEEIKRDRVLSDDEIRWLWKAAELVPQYGDLAKFLLLTGQRRNEAAGIREEEIDRAKKLWTMLGDRTKNKDAHSVPLSKSCMSIIEGIRPIKNKRGYLFAATEQTHISAFSAGKTLIDEKMQEIADKERGKKTEIPRWTLHDLRRTAASGMARIGVVLPVIEKVLNHKSGSFGGIVGVYQRHGYDDEKREALERWASFVTGLNAERGKVVKLRTRA
jgi:integrase